MEMSGQLCALVALPTGKQPMVPIREEGVWAPRGEKAFPSHSKNWTMVAQPVTYLLYWLSHPLSKLAVSLKLIYAYVYIYIYICNNFVIVCFKLINFVFQISPFSVAERSSNFISYIVLNFAVIAN
jgi:hypothetical protein